MQLGCGACTCGTYADRSDVTRVTSNQQAVCVATQYADVPCKFTFDLLTLKLVSESLVTSATYVPILVFPGLSVLDLGPIYTTDRRHHR